MVQDFSVKQTTFTGYAGVKAGSMTPSAGGTFNTNVAILGAQVEKNGTYLKAEVGAGTALTAKIEAGHEFGIAKNMGLDLSANVQASKSFSKNSITVNDGLNTDMNVATPFGDVLINNSQNELLKSSWRPTDLRAAARAQLKYKPTSKLTFGAGIECAVRHSTNPELTFTSTNNIAGSVTINGETTPFENHSELVQKYNDKRTKINLSPVITADWKIGKKNQFEAFADASLTQREIGIRYNF